MIIRKEMTTTDRYKASDMINQYLFSENIDEDDIISIQESWHNDVMLITLFYRG